MKNLEARVRNIKKEAAKLANTTVPVDEATIQERQVTVEVLTIGTKQVTQAMYKQFPTEYAVDPKTGLLKGKVWGWINLHGESPYGGSKCKEDNKHYHIVWEDRGKLRRCIVEIRHLGCYKIRGDEMEFTWQSPNHKASWSAIHNTGQLFIAVSGVWK